MDSVDAVMQEALVVYVHQLIEGKLNDKFQLVANIMPDVLNILDAAKQTLLHVAVRSGNFEIMEYLINSDCVVDAQDIFGWTPLMRAAQAENESGDDRITALLLENNADIFATNSEGQTALQIYLSSAENDKKYSSTLKKFLERLKSNNQDDEQLLATLIRAGCRLDVLIYLHDANVTKLYLERLSYVDNKIVNYAFLNCMNELDDENLHILLHYGVNVTYWRWLFLEVFYDNLKMFCEIKNYDPEQIQKYIDLIIDLKLLDRETVRFFDSLFQIMDSELLRIIIRSGINEFVKEEFGYEPIVYIFSNSSCGVFDLIMSENINIYVRGSIEESALHCAVEGCNYKMVCYLLERYVNPNIVDKYGKTPIFYMFNKEKSPDNIERMMIELLSYGTNVHRADCHQKIFIDYSKDNVIKERVIEILMSHYALLGYAVRQRITNVIRCTSHARTLKVFQKSIEEIEKMRTHRVSVLITLYDIIAQGNEIISHRIKSVDLDELILWINGIHKPPEYCNYYCKLISMHMLAALRTSERREGTVALLRDCIEVLRPHHVILHKICSFLTFNDMHDFA